MSDKKISELIEKTSLDSDKRYFVLAAEISAEGNKNYGVDLNSVIPSRISQLVNDVNYIVKEDYDFDSFLTEEQAENIYLTKEQAENTYAKKVVIPTKLSLFENDTNFITEDYVEGAIDALLQTLLETVEPPDLSDYAKKTDIPTNYITSIPSEYVTDSELADYATKDYVSSEIGDIDFSGYVTDSELASFDYATKGYVDDKVANIDISDTTIDLTGYAKLTDIPTNVSEFNNDKGYITSIPSEYITESELLGYDYATESYVNTKIAEAELGDENYQVDLSSYVTEDELAAMGYTTTTQMNSAIQQSASNITSTVSSTYATKDELNGLSNTYVTKDEFDQTNEDFTFKIQQSGGGNLLKNTKFKDGTKYWSYDNWDSSNISGITQYVDVASMDYEWTHGTTNILGTRFDVITIGGYIRSIIGSNWAEVEPNGTYSISFYYRQHRANCYYEIQGMKADGSYSTIHSFDFDATYDQTDGTSWSKDFSSWWYETRTFIIPNDIIKVQFWVVVVNQVSDASEDNAYVWLGEPCLVKGPVPMHWVPHESELYDGIVKIDQNGIAVQHGDNNRSVLDNEALKFYEGDTLKSKVDGGVFKFTDDNGVELGEVGCGTWAYDRTKAISVLKATYGHSVALSAPYSSTATTGTVGIVHSSHEHWVAEDMVLYKGINMSQPIVCGMMNFKPQWGTTMQDYDGSKYGHLTLWGRTDDINGYEGYIAGNNYLGLGILAGNMAKIGLGIYEDSTQTNGVAIHGHGPLNMHGFSITNSTSTMSLNAQSQYTNRLLSTGTNENISYGTLSYDDNEIRWCWKENVFTYQDCDVDPETDEWIYYDRYICYIELPIFMAENIEADYHINVSKMSWGDWRIREKNQYYFILESEENDFAFTFEVVAKLKDGSTIDTNSYIANDSVEGINGVTPEEFVDLEIPMDNNESLTS